MLPPPEFLSAAEFIFCACAFLRFEFFGPQPSEFMACEMSLRNKFSTESLDTVLDDGLRAAKAAGIIPVDQPQIVEKLLTDFLH